MNRKWMPITAGVLVILYGVINIFSGFIYMGIGFDKMSFILKCILVLIFISGLLSAIGGTLSIIRKSWGLALTGAIFSSIPSLLYNIYFWKNFLQNYHHYTNVHVTILPFVCLLFFSILAIVFTVLSRKQFS